MKRIGLVGCGVVTNYGHLPAIAATPALQLAAVFDPDPARAEAAKPAFGAGHESTRQLSWSGEKNFMGMYAAFAHALETGETGDLPTGEDGLRTTQIARQATEKAIQNR